MKQEGIAIQVNINKEIRHYEEDVFMGLSLRQLLCSGAAIGAAAGIYFVFNDALGKETVSWLCIVCAAPLAAAGFFEYDGLTFEKFLSAVWRSCFLCAGPRLWRSENRYMRKPAFAKRKKGDSQ